MESRERYTSLTEYYNKQPIFVHNLYFPTCYAHFVYFLSFKLPIKVEQIIYRTLYVSSAVLELEREYVLCFWHNLYTPTYYAHFVYFLSFKFSAKVGEIIYRTHVLPLVLFQNWNESMYKCIYKCTCTQLKMEQENQARFVSLSSFATRQ